MKTHEEQIANRCRFFNGTQHEACEAGINYQSLTGDGVGWGLKLPCFLAPLVVREEPVERATCEKASFPTMAEAKAEAEEALGRLRSTMEKIASGVCPYCDKSITLRQVGSCVYGSCGHRLYQGKVPRERHTQARKP